MAGTGKSSAPDRLKSGHKSQLAGREAPRLPFQLCRALLAKGSALLSTTTSKLVILSLEIVHSAVIYLGNPLLYLILQLEAFKQTCAGPAKQLDTKDFLVVHRLECIYTKKPTLSPSFFLERIRFKVSFLTLHTKTPHPTINNRFLPTPSVTFPVYSRPDRDEPRELPADLKQDIIDSALTIPRWAHQQQLCSSRIDRNFLR